MGEIFALLRREWVYLWYYTTILLQQAVPYWALGILLGSAVSVFGTSKIHRLFAAPGGGAWGVLILLPASLLGIASPLFMYGALPVAASFFQKGVPEDWLAAFMLTGPATKITNLGALKVVLGGRHFLYYLAFVLLSAFLSGNVVNALFR